MSKTNQIEKQAKAFRLAMRHGIYPIYNATPMVRLGGGRSEFSTGETYEDAVLKLCDDLKLTEINMLKDADEARQQYAKTFTPCEKCNGRGWMKE